MRSGTGSTRVSSELSPGHHHAGDIGSFGLLASVAAWLAGATFWWLVAEVLLGSVIPFTFIVILPTDKELLNPALDKRSMQAGQLLARWGKLHAVRSLLSAVALIVFLYLAIFTKSARRTATGNPVRQIC